MGDGCSGTFIRQLRSVHSLIVSYLKIPTLMAASVCALQILFAKVVLIRAILPYAHFHSFVMSNDHSNFR